MKMPDCSADTSHGKGLAALLVFRREDMSTPTTDIFAFRYTLFKVEARIQRTSLKIGLNTITVPMNRIEYVYVDEGRDETTSR